MREECPLPLDWLDLIEGLYSDASFDHLTSCDSCRVVVEGIRRSTASGPDLVFRSVDGRPWIAQVKANPTVGDIWLTSAGYSLSSTQPQVDRLIVLIASEISNGAADAWFDVVPISTSTESVGPTDVLVRAEETTLECPLRMVWSAQTVLPVNGLDSYLGELLDDGRAVLAQCLDGTVDLARTGPPIEGGWDLRLEADESIRQAAVVLGGPRAEYLEGSKETSSDGPGNVIRLALSWRAPAGRDAYALAAQSGSLAGSNELVAEAGPLSVSLVLRYDLKSDVISARVENAAALPKRARVVIHAPRLAAPFASDWFVPTPGEQIVVSEGLCVFLKELETVEMVTE